MINDRLTSDFVIFFDVHSFEIYARDERGNSIVIAACADYDDALSPKRYHHHLVSSFKRATMFIKRAWRFSHKPTVTCILADAFTHTVFHYVTHEYNAEKQLGADAFTRAVMKDLQKRAWAELDRDFAAEKNDHGFVDAVLYSLKVNGYDVNLPLAQKVRAKEYSFLYGASICPRKTYRAIREHGERADITVLQVSSATLQVLRGFNSASLHNGQALMVVGDTVSSIVVAQKNRIQMHSLPVGIYHAYAALSPTARTWMMLGNQLGIARRHEPLFTKQLAKGLREAMLSHSHEFERTLDAHTLERLSIVAPGHFEISPTVIESMQSVLYPGTKRYQALREAAHIIKRSHIMHL